MHENESKRSRYTLYNVTTVGRAGLGRSDRAVRGQKYAVRGNSYNECFISSVLGSRGRGGLAEVESTSSCSSTQNTTAIRFGGELKCGRRVNSDLLFRYFGVLCARIEHRVGSRVSSKYKELLRTMYGVH